MRSVKGSMSALLVVGLLVAAEAPSFGARKAAAKKVPANLQGYWAAISWQKGEDVDGGMAPSRRSGLTIKDNQAEWTEIRRVMKAGKGQGDHPLR
jgi:hypothetical protein